MSEKENGGLLQGGLEQGGPELPAEKGLFSENRDDIIAAFNKMEGRSVADPDNSGSEDPTGNGEEDSGAGPDKTDDAVDKAAAGDAPASDSPSDKDGDIPKDGMVKDDSHLKGALKEERAKRKLLRDELDGIKKQLAEQKEDNKILFEDLKKQMKGDVDDYGDVDDGEIPPAIKAELDKLKEENQKLKEATGNDAAADQQKLLDKAVVDTDAKLAEEGFPGFSDFRSLVTEELIDMIGKDEEAIIHDTPEGWSKIWKETVFPKLQAITTAKDKKRVKDEKNAAKEDANLASSGKKPVSPAEEKDVDTLEEYMKMRKSRLL
jgi:hypothetical protein